jgi:hypothetical protein
MAGALLLTAAIAPPIAAAPKYPRQANNINPTIDLSAHGVEFVALRLSAGGYMLDMRYRVLDIEKARTFLNTNIPATLEDHASGAILAVPVSAKLGKMRSSGRRAVEGQVLVSLFANPGQIVQAGNKVTLRIGDIVVPDITVEG